MEKVTQKQFLKARRKIVLEWITVNALGISIGVFSFWFLGSIVAWTCIIGEWHLAGRIIFAFLSFIWSAFIFSSVTVHCAGEFKVLKEVKNVDQLKVWCEEYGYKYI